MWRALRGQVGQESRRETGLRLFKQELSFGGSSTKGVQISFKILSERLIDHSAEWICSSPAAAQTFDL